MIWLLIKHLVLLVSVIIEYKNIIFQTKLKFHSYLIIQILVKEHHSFISIL